MNDYRDNMFVVPILHLECSNWETKKQELLELSSKEFFVDKSQVNTSYFSKKDGYVNQNKNEIVDLFRQELFLFKDHFGFSEVFLDSFWFQSSKNGQNHQVHNHGSLGYTMICYVEYEDVHSPTVFVSPFNNFIDGSTLFYEPKNIKSGSVVFFPSVILHYAPSNFTEKNRTILSGNLIVK